LNDTVENALGGIDNQRRRKRIDVTPASGRKNGGQWIGPLRQALVARRCYNSAIIM
jgi:hypothetical protein